MLGFGAIGEFALGEVGGQALALSSDILEKVVTQLVEEGKLSTRPPQLYHFTALETASQIIINDNIRLSHAEYSNDQTEMERAKDIIRSELQNRSSNPFFSQVLLDYEALAPTLDAYVFCMSSGREDQSPPQDMLSQWRAYGQDGRGACLTLDSAHLARLVGNIPGLRINPVIYENATQIQFVGEILNQGLGRHGAGNPSAREATIAALVFATPLMKAIGFAEEREWRLIFMPPQVGPRPDYHFQPRRDFLAPFINLEDLWKDLRPKLLSIPELLDTLPNYRPNVNLPPLVLITEVMMGPSGHQLLNERSFSKLLVQVNRLGVNVLRSAIPYRSLN